MIRFATTFLISAMLLLLGCDVPQSQTIVDVSGTITQDGVPLADAKIMFVPIQAKDENRHRNSIAFGKTDADGKYQLSLPGGISGARTGMHLVMISKMSEQAQQLEHEETPGFEPSSTPGGEKKLSPRRKLELRMKAAYLASPFRSAQPEGETVFSSFNRDSELQFDIPAEGTTSADFEVGRDPLLID